MTDPMARAREEALNLLNDQLSAMHVTLEDENGCEVYNAALPLIERLLTREAEVRGEEREDFAPCPTCHQYSHSLGEDRIAEAFRHFQSMMMSEIKGYPTHHAFDERTRDAAQVLVSAIRDGATGGVQS